MITIFNRKELAITYDMKEQARIRDILADNNIDYDIKTVNRMSPSPMAAGTRTRMGSLGQSQNEMYEYIIYVRKEDYEKAYSAAKKIRSID